jgi:hypothetical protein
MKLITLILLLLIFNALKAEYYGNCLLFNVTLTLKDKSKFTGWTVQNCFDDDKSKVEFINSLKDANKHLEKILSLYYSEDVLVINAYTHHSNIGWIIPYSEMKRIPKANIVSLKVNQIDSIEMGCYKITRFKKEDLGTLTKYNIKNSLHINNQSDDSYRFYWSDSSVLSNKLFIEVTDKIKKGSEGEDYLAKQSDELFKIGIIIENCRGD